jgi:hypothetical protein
MPLAQFTKELGVPLQVLNAYVPDSVTQLCLPLLSWTCRGWTCVLFEAALSTAVD